MDVQLATLIKSLNIMDVIFSGFTVYRAQGSKEIITHFTSSTWLEMKTTPVKMAT